MSRDTSSDTSTDNIASRRFVLATFYRPGRLAVSQLRNVGVPVDHLRVVTYDHDRNRDLLAYLDDQGVAYTTDPIDDRETVGWLRDHDPDVLCSLYYRDVIPEEVLALPTYGGFNLHPSLLPRHSGALSVPWAMVEGDEVTGFTYHRLATEVDAGNILRQEKVPITPQDTAYSLYHRLIHAGMTEFLPTVEQMIAGDPGEPQEGERTYHGRDDLPNAGHIDHSWSDERIDRFIRAMYYPPFAPAVATFDSREFEVTSFREYERLRAHYGV